MTRRPSEAGESHGVGWTLGKRWRGFRNLPPAIQIVVAAIFLAACTVALYFYWQVVVPLAFVALLIFLVFGGLTAMGNAKVGGINPQTVTPFGGGPVEYESYQAFKADSPMRLTQGWRIASVTDVPQRPGAARIATIGLGAVIWKPKPHVLVVYEREKVSSNPAVVPATASPKSEPKRFCRECGSPTQGKKFCGDCGAATT